MFIVVIAMVIARARKDRAAMDITPGSTRLEATPPVSPTRCVPAEQPPVMSCRARTRHTYDGTRRIGRMT
ncbi:hypothetical protein [Streptomyces bobili]|uniref:hypothetical protein n=1 Tax=Streptomyces bobili TaxID=67280 RepID=UPI0037B638B5